MDQNGARIDVLKLILEELKAGTGDGLSQRDISKRTGVPERDVVSFAMEAFSEMEENASMLMAKGGEISFGVEMDSGKTKKLEKYIRGLDRGDNIPDWS